MGKENHTVVSNKSCLYRRNWPLPVHVSLPWTVVSLGAGIGPLVTSVRCSNNGNCNSKLGTALPPSVPLSPRPRASDFCGIQYNCLPRAPKRFTHHVVYLEPATTLRTEYAIICLLAACRVKRGPKCLQIVIIAPSCPSIGVIGAGPATASTGASLALWSWPSR